MLARDGRRAKLPCDFSGLAGDANNSGGRPKAGEEIAVRQLLDTIALMPHRPRRLNLGRDEPNETGVPRKGVPQAPQTHVILTPSYEAVRELFPGLIEELETEGASIYDSGLPMAAILNGCWVKPGKCDLHYVDCTRSLYEKKIRSRVLKLAHVTFLGRRVVRSLVEDDKGMVTGVDAEDVGTGGKVRFEADVVIDASGRASHAPRWLEALGFGPPATEEVKIDLAYVGALYESAPSYEPRAKLHVI